jgi:hypothetical protein
MAGSTIVGIPGRHLCGSAALYLHRGDLRISQTLRRWPLGAALVPTLIVATGFARLDRVFHAEHRPESGLKAVNGSRYFHHPRFLLGTRHDPSLDRFLAAAGKRLLVCPYYQVFKIATRTSLAVFGLTTAISVLRLLLAPYGHAQLRRFAWELGRTPPSFWHSVSAPVTMFLVQVSCLTVPLIVWRATSHPPAKARQNLPILSERLRVLCF